MSNKKCQQCKRTDVKFRDSRKICTSCRHLNNIVSKGEVRPPDYTEVTTARYKEPMTKVDNGFGYIGAITETNDGKMIQCHICGYFYGRLGLHIKNKHKIAPRDYKIKYGLRINDGLMSTEARKAAQNTYNTFARATQRQQSATRAARKKWDREAWKINSRVWSPQLRNEKGNCKEQTIAKIQNLAKTHDGIARSQDFISEYGGVDVVSYWFGTWQEGVKAAGLETYTERVQRIVRAQRDDIPAKLKAFYDKHGRTPQWSDCRADNDLPSTKTICQEFGSMNNARQAAGVPMLILIPGKGWVEQAV